MSKPDLIIEMPVYCGARKVWRVLNLSTSTVYSVEYPTYQAAEASVENGSMRGDKMVKLEHVVNLLGRLRAPSILAAWLEQIVIPSSRSRVKRTICQRVARDLRIGSIY